MWVSLIINFKLFIITLIYLIVICWSETTNPRFLFTCFDIITFIYLTALLNHPSSLGPFGAMHLAILQAIRWAFEAVSLAIRSAFETVLLIQSIFEALQPVLLLFATSDGGSPTGESRPPTSVGVPLLDRSQRQPRPRPRNRSKR